MTIAYKTSTSGVFTTVASVKKLTIPAVTAVNDFLLLEYSGASTFPDADPTGWTRLDRNNGGTCYGTWWYRVAVNGDAGGSVTVTAASNAKTALALTVHSGVDPASPIVAHNSRAETTSSTTHAGPAITVPGGWTGRIIRSLALKDTSTAASATWSPPAGTLRVSANTGGVSQAVSVQSSSSSNTSSYAAGSWVVDAASQNAVTFAVLLNPAGSTPPAPTTLLYKRSGSSLVPLYLARREGNTIVML